MQTDPTSLGMGGGTVVHPIALLIVGAAILLMLVLPRKYIIVPLFVVAFFIPLEQRVVIGPLHFMMLRIVLIFAWIRLILTGLQGGPGAPSFRMNSIDKVLVLWVLSSVVTYVALWRSWDAFINRTGFLYNAFGIYFLMRFLCCDPEDVNRTLKVVAIISMMIAICMVNEQISGRNLFAAFGGVPEITPIREGKLRSQGAFLHSILAGSFGAALLPLFVGLWCQGRKGRMLAALGLVSATVITLTSGSSTPLVAYIAGIIGLCMWPFRRRMRAVRRGIVLCLVSLHLVMKAPVWALINRVSLVGGSSSWHRFELVDEFIRRFREWWLWGTTTNVDWGLDTWDIANQYVAVGTRGGLLTLLLFLGIITRGFGSLGIARKAAEGNFKVESSLWALGAALFSHVAGFFGIAYFDQTILGWYLLLAMISAATAFTTDSLHLEPRDQVHIGMSKAHFARRPQPVLPRTERRPLLCAGA